jgi:hypothetical protein
VRQITTGQNAVSLVLQLVGEIRSPTVDHIGYLNAIAFGPTEIRRFARLRSRTE